MSTDPLRLNIFQRTEDRTPLTPFEQATSNPLAALETPPAGVTSGENIFLAGLMRYRIANNFAAANTQSTPPTQAGPPTLTTYRNQALALIGGRGGDVRERNERISGAYAHMYSLNPNAFRWSGAAAHASGQVGLVLDIERIGTIFANLPSRAKERVVDFVLRDVPREILQRVAPQVPDRVWDVILSDNPLSRFARAAALAAIPNYVIEKIVGVGVQFLAGRLEGMLANGNITIYESIAPAQLAYQRGGMAEMRRVETTITNPTDRARFHQLVLAFDKIDRGANLQRAGNFAAGERLIRAGNLDIINFEQRVIAQPVAFDPDPALTYVLSPFAFGDLDARPANIDLNTATFYWSNHAPHSIGDANQRVDWIANEIFPAWYAQRQNNPGLVNQHMQTIINHGRTAGGNY